MPAPCPHPAQNIEKSADEKIPDVAELEKMYSEAESADRDVFAEMRSNILIMNGQHYRKTIGRGIERNLKDLNVKKSKRVRLVKNHTQKAINDAKDVVASMVPGVMPYPAVEGETRHQKAAELAHKVWKCGREKNQWDDFREESIDNFFEIGEVCSLIYFDPLKGGLRSFHQKVEETADGPKPVFYDPEGNKTFEIGRAIYETQQAEVNGQLVEQRVQAGFEDFEPCPDGARPEFYGQLVIERVPAFDVLRPKSARNMKEAPWLMVRKMIENDYLKGLITASGDLSEEEKEKQFDKIKEGGGSTFKIFNAGNGSFEETENQTLLKQIFYRQSPKYPKGYYQIWTEFGIIFEDSIPFGEFGEAAYPVKWEGFDRFETSARGFSPIKRVRPAQLEVNRCASKITEHQLTVGDDKVILAKGAKFDKGVDQPGIRVFTTTGQPTVVAGRSGEQFVGYLEHNISEIYRLLSVEENKNPSAQTFDMKAELFKMQRQKLRFSKPSGKLERYFKSICETYLFLEQKYMNEERFTRVVGSMDSVDFKFFNEIDRLDYEIKIEEVSGDLETQMGKTMELETIIQYAGIDLDEQTKVALLSQFPILNRQQAFKHLLIHHKNIESDILTLERGTPVPARKMDNHELVLQYLTNRMAQKDFYNLNPEIQKLFEQKYQEHEMILEKQVENLREANAGLIPTGGSLVRCDVYVNDDPANPQKTSRLELPMEALQWLEQKLSDQGLVQERLQQIGDMQTQINILGGGGNVPPATPQPPINA